MAPTGPLPARFRRERTMRYPAIAAAVAAAALATAIGILRPDKTVRVVTGLVAHSLCSETLVSGIDPEATRREMLAPMPGVRRLLPLMSINIDRDRGSVTAAIAGLFANRAVFHRGYGCNLVFDRDVAADWPPPATVAPGHDGAGEKPVAPKSPRLEAALGRAFAEPASGPQRGTKAIVIVRDDRIIAERYADGYGPDTKLMSWSVAKSVTNAMLGILVQQRKLALDAPAPVPEWQSAGDPRQAITIAQLMRMTSGLALDETNTGFDPNSRMLYTEPDMAGFVAPARLIASPGTRYHYSSPGTILLSRIVRDQVGGSAADVAVFARRELFAPLGMGDVTIEFDDAGTPIGSTYIYATARDWARFGSLYLNDGVVNGRRILPEGWVEFSAIPGNNPDGYAAGFFSNRGSSEYGALRVRSGMAADSFFASGTLGQRIVIMPADHLVVARFGLAQDWPDFDIVGLVHLVADVRAACAAEQC